MGPAKRWAAAGGPGRRRVRRRGRGRGYVQDRGGTRAYVLSVHQLALVNTSTLLALAPAGQTVSYCGSDSTAGVPGW